LLTDVADLDTFYIRPTCVSCCRRDVSDEMLSLVHTDDKMSPSDNSSPVWTRHKTTQNIPVLYPPLLAFNYYNVHGLRQADALGVYASTNFYKTKNVFIKNMVL